MRPARSIAIATLVLGTALSSAAIAAGPSAAEKQMAANALVTLSQLNLAVKQDLRFNGGGEIEGKIWIGRDALQTGGANTTQVGFGASNGQGIAASTFNSVTVGRDANIGFQVKNSVGGSYGVLVGRNSAQELNLQDSNATVKVGGNSAGAIKTQTGQTTWVGGNYTAQNGFSLADNNSVWVGGNSTRIQGGNSNINVKVGGNLGSIDLAGNSSAQIGGALGTDGNYSATKSNLTALGNISKLQMNANGLTVKSGGSISEISISNASKAYASGSINVQNNNGGAGAVNANCGAAYASCSAVSAPTSPGAPAIGSVDAQTTTMFDNFAALSKSLANLAKAGHTGTLLTTNGGQAYTFSSTATSGYTVFNVDQTIFSKNEFAYNFANTTTPIVINVKNTGACTTTLTCSYTMNSNFTGNAAQFNRNVIWNFVDASSVVLNRQFQGSVVAYLADMQANVIEGSVVAKNFTMTNEIHLGTFSGNNGFILTGTIPEPANWAMMIAGFGIVGGVVRRRRSILIAA
jgi:choice-of-anchor A domain-containing protein